MVQFFDDSGAVTEEFTTALPGMLGRENMNNEDGTPDKTFDDIKTLDGLVKSYHSTKKMAGELGTKIEGGFFPPRDDASDEDKAKFRGSMLRRLGHPEAPEGYKFPEPPDGRKYAEGEKAKWAAMAYAAGVPQDILTAFITARHAEIAEDDKTATESIEKELTEAIEILEKDTDWLGDKKAVNLRTIYNTIGKFGKPELQAAIKEANLYDNHDMKAWTALVGVSSMPFLLMVGKAMSIGAGELPSGERTQQSGPDIKAAAQKAGVTEEEMVKMKAMYDQSPEMFT